MWQQVRLPRSLDALFSVAISAPLIAWLSITMLSGTLFQGNELVTSATLSTVATAVGFWIVAIFGHYVAAPRFASFPTKAKESMRSSPIWKAVEPAGMAVLILCSLIACLPAAKGMPGVVLPCTFGFMVGIGLSLSLVGFIVRQTRQSFHAASAHLFLSILIGGLIFFGYEFLVPRELMPNLLFVLPAFSLIVSLFDTLRSQMSTRPIDHFAPNLPSALSAALSVKQTSLYAVLAGFLLGYCYNVYPKSTRLAGSYERSSVESAFGLVTMPVIRFFLILVVVIAILTIIWRTSQKFRGYLAVAISAILFAATFFSLPLMVGGAFELLLVSSLTISAPVWLATLHLFSIGETRRCLSQILCLSSGQIFGSLVAAGLIELTTPSPYVIAPQAFQNLTIIGVPTFCFVATLIVILFIINSAAHLNQLTQEGKAKESESEIANAAQQMASRYSLTNRESEVLELLLVGRSGTYISKQLSLSASTVKTHTLC